MQNSDVRNMLSIKAVSTSHQSHRAAPVTTEWCPVQRSHGVQQWRIQNLTLGGGAWTLSMGKGGRKSLKVLTVEVVKSHLNSVFCHISINIRL